MSNETGGEDNQDFIESIALPKMRAPPSHLPSFLRVFWYRWQRRRIEKKTKVMEKEIQRREAESKLLLEQLEQERK